MKEMERRLGKIEENIHLKEEPLKAVSDAETEEEFEKEYQAYIRAGGTKPFIWLK
jgi:hypothetical protein